MAAKVRKQILTQKIREAQGLRPSSPLIHQIDLPSVLVCRELFVSWQPSMLKNVSQFPDNQPHRAQSRGRAARRTRLAVSAATGLPGCAVISELSKTLGRFVNRPMNREERGRQRRKWRWFIIHERDGVNNPAKTWNTMRSVTRNSTSTGRDIRGPEKTKEITLTFPKVPIH